MAPAPLEEAIHLDPDCHRECAFTEIISFAREAFTYRIVSLSDTPLPWTSTIAINKSYARRGTEKAWQRACDHVKYGTSRWTGPARVRLRHVAEAFKCRLFYGDITDEDAEADCWYREMKVCWDDKYFETKVRVPKASIKKEVDAVLVKRKEEAEAWPSIEVVEEEQEVKRAVAFTVSPQEGKRHRMDVWRVDGTDLTSVIGSVVMYERFDDGSKNLTVKVDVEGIEGLLLQGVLPNGLFAAHFREVENVDVLSGDGPA